MLALHASRTTGDDRTVAVIVDAARPAQVSAMIVDAYGLTARQREERPRSSPRGPYGGFLADGAAHA